MQKKIEEVEQKTTQMWKIIYGLATLKLGQEDLFKETDKGEEQEEREEDKEEDKEEEEEKEEEKIKEEKREEEKVEETQETETEATIAEQQIETSAEPKPSTLLTCRTSYNLGCY